MNIKLLNRKAIHEKLEGFVGGLAVSDHMVDTICSRLDLAFTACAIVSVVFACLISCRLILEQHVHRPGLCVCVDAAWSFIHKHLSAVTPQADRRRLSSGVVRS